MYIWYGNTPWVEFTQKFYFLGWNEKHRLRHVDFIPLVYNQTKSFEFDTTKEASCLYFLLQLLFWWVSPILPRIYIELASEKGIWQQEKWKLWMWWSLDTDIERPWYYHLRWSVTLTGWEYSSACCLLPLGILPGSKFNATTLWSFHSMSQYFSYRYTGINWQSLQT